MGDRGPKPVPTKLLQLRGSNRAGRGNNKREPVFRLAIEAGRKGPYAPKYFSDTAKAVWKERINSVRDAKLVTEVDLHALERLCHSMGRWRNLAAELDKAEEWERATNAKMLQLVHDSGSLPGKNARTRISDARALHATQAARAKRLAQVLSKAEETCTRLEREFGFTPSARSRVEISPVAAPPVGSGDDATGGQRSIFDLTKKTGSEGA